MCLFEKSRGGLIVLLIDFNLWPYANKKIWRIDKQKRTDLLLALCNIP